MKLSKGIQEFIDYVVPSHHTRSLDRFFSVIFDISCDNYMDGEGADLHTADSGSAYNYVYDNLEIMIPRRGLLTKNDFQFLERELLRWMKANTSIMRNT